VFGRSIAILASTTWIIFAQDSYNFDRKGNVNIGGGAAIPVHPTSHYATPSGTLAIGAGFDFNKRHSIVAEFMWAGLSAERAMLPPLVNPLIANVGDRHVDASGDLFSVTANYMVRKDWHRFGMYGIGGGGWYYRYAKLSEHVVQPGTPCSINLLYYGYTCSSGYIETDETLLSTGSHVFGGNVGFGITMRVADSGEKFYLESRYHYAPHAAVATHVIPITFGFRW
jgi:hypothetical protein